MALRAFNHKLTLNSLQMENTGFNLPLKLWYLKKTTWNQAKPSTNSFNFICLWAT